MLDIERVGAREVCEAMYGYRCVDCCVDMILVTIPCTYVCFVPWPRLPHSDASAVLGLVDLTSATESILSTIV